MLLCSQTQSFASIRNELLTALRTRGINEIHGEPVPEDSEDIVLGVPLDKKNLEKGWVNLEIPEFDEGDAKRKGGVKKGSVFNQSPLGAGLGDGDMLAFRFRKEAKDEMELDEDWDVTLPRLDDDTGSQA